MTYEDLEDVSENLAEQTKSCQKESSLPTYNESALGQYDFTEVKDDIATLEKERDCMAKNANMTAIAEYRKKEADYLTRYVVHTIIVMLCGIHYYYHIV